VLHPLTQSPLAGAKILPAAASIHREAREGKSMETTGKEVWILMLKSMETPIHGLKTI
jgi:hypothetical protein